MKQKLKLDNFAIFSSAWVNGRRTYGQLDTGASKSFVKSGSKIDLTFVRETEVKGALGSSSSQEMILRDLKFLGKSYTDMHVISVKSETKEKYSVRSDLTLGTDVLYDFDGICFDLKKNVIESSNREMNNKVNIEMKKGLAFFPLQFGNREVSALFDTGAGYSVLNKKYAKEFVIKKGRELEVSDPAGGKRRVNTFIQKNTMVGNVELNSNEFLILDLSEIEVILGFDLTFVFGVNMMLARKWMLKPNKKEMMIT
jgi:Retroviral aspartyl protease.